MLTIDHPPACTITGTVTPPHRRGRRALIFASPPRYRVVRAVKMLERLPELRRPHARLLMSVHWQALRAHSSWSRA
jgi:hypothetical protein